MKKIIFAICLGLTTINAEAITPLCRVHNVQQNNVYNNGYNKGKADAYSNVAKTVFFVGTAIFAGVLIYQLGKDSNWTAHDGQVGYRF